MYNRKGKESPLSKAIVMISLDGKTIKEYENASELNAIYDKGKANNLISRICINGGTAYGAFWLFKDKYLKLLSDNEFESWYLENKKRYVDRKDKMDINKAKAIYQLDKDTLEIIKEFENTFIASKETGVTQVQ